MTQAYKDVTASALVSLAKDRPFSSDLDSDIAEFKNGLIGSFQAYWSGQDASDGTLELWVSNVRDPSFFAPFPSSLTAIPSGRQSVLWNIGVIGFRYGFVRYKKGTATTGTLNVVAVGKHSAAGFA